MGCVSVLVKVLYKIFALDKICAVIFYPVYLHWPMAKQKK